MPLPGTYRDVVPALVAAGVLAADLGARLDGMAGMRNILAHDYVHVDKRQVWAAIDRHVDDLRAVHATLASLPELDRASKP